MKDQQYLNTRKQFESLKVRAECLRNINEAVTSIITRKCDNSKRRIEKSGAPTELLNNPRDRTKNVIKIIIIIIMIIIDFVNKTTHLDNS